MKKPAFFLCILLLTGPFLSADAKTVYNRHSRPGGVVILSFPENPKYWDGTAYLEDVKGNKLAAAGAFAYTERNAEKTRTLFIVGIPSTVRPGNYSLRYILNGAEEYEGIVNLEIAPKDFLSEEIPLNRRMSTLRSEPDPRKEEEAKEFIEILKSASKSAVFSSGLHRPPLDEYVTTSYFGDRRRYLYDDGTSAYSIHTGIDMAAPEGTSVYASGSGRVVFAKDRIITGKTVIIEHLPGVLGIYFHLHTIAVVRGDYVRKGQFIGTVGSTGLSTGNHLHWEIRVGGVAVDPEIFVEDRIIDKAVNFVENSPLQQKGGD